MNTQTEDKLESAMSQAAAQFDSIKEMVDALETARDGQDDAPDDKAYEAALEDIQEDALSVLVRDGWHQPGVASEGSEEYEILLCTGGPAVRIVGDLSQHDEPETARLECQDWFTPWTAWTGNCGAVEDVLLAYARCFWFGE